jgi:hypothetical protein
MRAYRLELRAHTQFYGRLVTQAATTPTTGAIARPRERRARRVAGMTSSRGDPSEPDLARVWPLRGFTAASVRMVQHLQRRNAAMRLA